MRIRRLTALLLAASLAIVGIAGCTSKEGGNKDKKEAKGRYVESQIELPAKEGEAAVSLIQGEEKGAVLFTHNPAAGTYKAYQYDGSQFTAEDVPWLNDAGSRLGLLSKVIRGEDGNLYALFSDDEANFHVAKDAGNGISQEILIPELKETDEMGMAPYASDIRADQDGNIFLAYPVTGEAVMYDQKTGDKIRSFKGGQLNGGLSMPMDVRDHSILLGNGDESGFVCYDTNSGEIKDEIKYAEMNGDGIVGLGENNDCIYADSEGLHHLVLGGSVSEDLIGENTSAFGMPQSGIMSIVQLEKDEYTALFNTQSTTGGITYQMYRYVYDKTAKAKPSKMLTVYGLKESSAVRQAIVKYQQKHPDVGIEYKTGNAAEGTGTKADSIRALNTELLGGSGADIIMLDGLPVDSYIEKGVLADLSKVVKEVEKESALSKNIIDPYKKDGHIYQIPTRYGIPLLMGDKEKVETLKSAEALSGYMANHGWEDFMEKADKEAQMRLLLNLYYTDIVNEKQQINTELLTKLIEFAGKAKDTDDNTVSSYYGGSGQPDISDWDVGGIGDLEKSNQVYSQEIKGIRGMMMPYHYLRKTGGSPSDVNGIYVPHDIAGINKASKNMGLAEDFVKMLLSEEVQSADVENGFPVNEQAIDAWVQGVDETPGENSDQITISSAASAEDGDGETEEPISETITIPLRSEVKALTDMGRKLTVPVQKDDIIGEMIQDGAKTYFEGSRSAGEAAKDIAEKADTYLSE